MSTTRQRALTALVLALAGVAGWLSGTGPGPQAIAPGPAELSRAQFYALSFEDGDGHRLSLGQWRDRVLVVNFWATWCPPCRREIPDFAELSKEYAERGVQFVGLGMDSAAAIGRFAVEQRVPYPLLVAGPSAMPIMESLGNPSMALPFTLIVDRGGEIRLRNLGPMNGESLRKALEPLVSG